MGDIDSQQVTYYLLLGAGLRKWYRIYLGVLECLVSFVYSFCDGGQVDVPFPDLFVTPNKFKPDNDADMLLFIKVMQDLSFAAARKRVLYKTFLKFMHFNVLKVRPDTKWRSHL